MIKHIAEMTVFAPLIGALIAGIAGHKIGRRGAHTVTILLMIVSLIGAAMLFKLIVLDKQTFNGLIYTWGVSGSFHFNVGFLIDNLTCVMMMLVTFVSLVVHVYSVGYMSDDPGYQRFFSYVSAFTFAMLMLVTANNFFQLFFGWEGVGLVSYLLIGFWFNKESAAQGSLKAFVVNRVGDFGFILGIAAILDFFGSVDYNTVFSHVSTITDQTITIIPGMHWSLITVICILLFIGAMGKSAQIPLHVWLPESMEGPTPISALIHAATMVTAGVYMVARMSPLFEFSEVALSLILVIGASGALFLGILAFVEYDIKRVIAYSTMSQLGYMMAADGASAFSAGIFHLLMHGCFKALLFLSAGSVIVAMHHEQDMRKMGNLKKYLPVTCATFLVGAFALAAIPPFSGYYSKDAIIEAVHYSTIPGATYAYWCLLLGAFVTGYYIFRAYFMAFHTEERMSPELKAQLKESPWTMQTAMIALAIPATVLGGMFASWILYDTPTILGSSVYVASKYNVMADLQSHFHGILNMTLHSVTTLPFWFAISGIFMAWITVVVAPKFPATLKKYMPWLHQFLVGQYGFDAFNDLVFVKGGRKLSQFFYDYADKKLIDEFIVDGSGRGVARIAQLVRKLQTGYLYHYVFAMIIGLVVFLVWLVLGK
jgi:NADH-quinone oxidoreductase subunit L